MRHGWMAAALSVACAAAGAQTVSLATSDFPPFASETLPERGFYVALVKATWREAGFEPRVSFLPWARGQQETLAGRQFATFPYLVTAERERDYRFSAPIYSVQTRVFVTADTAWDWQQLSELRGRTICRQRASTNPPPLLALIESGEIRLEEAPTLAACLGMLRLKRADFVAINAPNGWFTVEQSFGSQEGFKTVGPAVATVTHHLMVGRQHPQGEAWLKRFDEALQRLRQRGEVKALEQRLMPGQ